MMGEDQILELPHGEKLPRKAVQPDANGDESKKLLLCEATEI